MITINKALNIALLIVMIILWGNVFFIKGLFGAVSWALLKLFLAPAGLILITIFLVFIFLKRYKKKHVSLHNGITGLLLLIISLPLLMLFNVVPIKYPANLEKVTPSITIHSPFKEPVLVGWGGDAIEKNVPHVIWASERWAYDLVMTPESIGSSNLDDYGIYDKEMYAPIEGEVIAVYDMEEDIPPNTTDFLSLEGNYVYFKVHETGTYLLMNHLKKDSVVVKVGDQLEVGDYIGKIGNSGATSEPHLHIHHQRQDPTKTILPIFAEGLPLYFYVNEESTMLLKGDLLK